MGALLVFDTSLRLCREVGVKVEKLNLLVELGVRALSPVVKPAVSVGNQPPLVVQLVFAFRYEAGYFRPFNVVAPSILVQLPGFALDGYVGSPVERLIATASMPLSWFVVSGRSLSRSGHSDHVQQWEMSHSLMRGAIWAVRRSSHFPPVGSDFASFQCFQCLGDCIVCGCLAHIPCLFRHGATVGSERRRNLGYTGRIICQRVQSR